MAAVAFINKKNEVPANHLEVVSRDIGHQLLLSAKDSSFRVLPVKKLNEMYIWENPDKFSIGNFRWEI